MTVAQFILFLLNKEHKNCQHEDWISNEEYKKPEEKHTPSIVKKAGEMAKQVGGHGGMDFLMDWR